jgi:hypothetical protein
MLVAFVAIAVAARTEWHEERFSPLYLDETLAGTREVSVMFADLQGFTSFSERTPPARVAAMLNGYYRRLVPLLEADGGVVHQIIGDAVMVIFNQNGDQDDHAARAARTALAFQAAATEVAESHADWPRFRAGVNSGEVLAGVVGGPSGHRKHGVVGAARGRGAGRRRRRGSRDGGGPASRSRPRAPASARREGKGGAGRGLPPALAPDGLGLRHRQRVSSRLA